VGVRSRLEALEGRAQLRRRVTEGLPQVRARMVEHLDRVADLRYGELGPEEAARVEAMSAAVESRLASRRGGRVVVNGQMPRNQARWRPVYDHR
jgi:hypothetical protein